MFDKLTSFLTLACFLSTVLATPVPQTTTTSNDNLQPFTGNLGGSAPPTVVRADDGYTVQGQGTFAELASALAASCDDLKAQCTSAANSAAGRALGLTLAQCDLQDAQCRAAIAGVSDPQAQATAGKVRRADNVQPFTGALGGQPPAVTPSSSGQTFQVSDGASFTDLAQALAASCNVQQQNCLNANVPTSQCNEQANECLAAAAAAAADDDDASKGPRSDEVLEKRQVPPPPPPPVTPPPPSPPPAPRPRSEGLGARQVPPPPPPPAIPPPPLAPRPRSEDALDARQIPPPPPQRPPPPPPPATRPRSEALDARQVPPPPQNPPPPPARTPNRPRLADVFQKRQDNLKPALRLAGGAHAPPPPPRA